MRRHQKARSASDGIGVTELFKAPWKENLCVVQPKGGHEMPRGKKFTAEQIIRKVREAEVELARGKTVPEVVRKRGVTEQTSCR